MSSKSHLHAPTIIDQISYILKIEFINPDFNAKT